MSSSEQGWLPPTLLSELEWLAGEGPPTVARHARIVLGRVRGLSVDEVAAQAAVHPNTVRNCMLRFEVHGLRGLVHASAGKPKNVAFTDAVRDEIARVAMHSPAAVGEPYARWSLRRLRSYLLRRGVVHAISVEGLRQLLRGLPLPPAYWRRAAPPLRPLTKDVRRALEHMAQGQRADRRLRAQIVLAGSRGLSEGDIAAALHIGRATVRRWLRRFHRSGILGLQTLPRRPLLGEPVRQEIVRFAGRGPRRYGLNRSTWSLPALRSALIRRNIVRGISIAHLRRILKDAGVDWEQPQAPAEDRPSPAVG